MQNYKYLIVTDLDGTLLNRDEELSTAVINYVHELNKRDDVLFTFNTGRAWFDAKEIYDQLQLKGFVSCCNSAVLFNPHTSEIFYSYMSRKNTVNLLQSPLIADKLHHGHILTNKMVYDFDKTNTLDVANALNKDEANVYGIKLYYDDACENFNEKLEFIKAFKPADRVTIFKYPGLENIEIQAGYVQKEFAIKFLAHYYGVDYNNILTFGDNHNDISVLDGLSRSYAVDNASLQIKQYAKHVSKLSNDKDCVIHEVQKFLDAL